jgi:hypothetical protein
MFIISFRSSGTAKLFFIIRDIVVISILEKKEIATFLDDGYDVFAFSMPLLGKNNQPIVEIPRIGRLKITSHDHIKFLYPVNGHPVKYILSNRLSLSSTLSKRDIIFLWSPWSVFLVGAGLPL